MKRIFFGMVTLALLFVSCEKPVVQESTMTHETDSQWKNLGTPDTIKTEPLAQCQAIFGVGKYLNETFTDICNGDTVRGITFQFTAPSRNDTFEPFVYTNPKDGKSYELLFPFELMDILMHAKLDKNGKLMPGYYSSAISPACIGAILCNRKIHLNPGNVESYSCAAYHLWSGEYMARGYSITNAAMQIDKISEDNYHIELWFCVNPNGVVRYFYYEFNGNIKFV